MRQRQALIRIPKEDIPFRPSRLLRHWLPFLQAYGFRRVVCYADISPFGEKENRLQKAFPNITIEWAPDASAALDALENHPFFVFDHSLLHYADLWEMERRLAGASADAAWALRPSTGRCRLPLVEQDEGGRLRRLLPEGYSWQGRRYAGVCLCSPSFFEKFPGHLPFSATAPPLERCHIQGVCSRNSFFDYQAPTHPENPLPQAWTLPLLRRAVATQEWTLFLDRDGVINQRLPGDYVKKVEEFRFMRGSLPAIRSLGRRFARLFVATNQQGVGKRLMRGGDLEKVHGEMLRQVTAAGGRIDAVYACTALEADNDKCRKPNIGMALQAQKEYPAVDFSRSVMVGDSVSDIRMGKRLGMVTVFLETKGPREANRMMGEGADFHFRDLRAFAEALASE